MIIHTSTNRITEVLKKDKMKKRKRHEQTARCFVGYYESVFNNRLTAEESSKIECHVAENKPQQTWL